MTLLLDMISITFVLGTPLILAGLGGLFSERCGVVNIALEGGMMIGGFAGASAVVILEQAGSPNPWLALFIATLAGIAFASLHAFASIHMKADQTISGTALNVLAGGLTIYLSEIMFGAKSTMAYSNASTFGKETIPFLSDIPVIGVIFTTYQTIYLTFILVIIAWFILYKTPFGLQFRSCGEFPQASASMGISVTKMRWIGVLTSGALSAIAGAALVLTTSPYYFVGSIHGLGFVAIATLIFGRWHPFGLLGAGLFFGFAQTLARYSTSIPGLSSLPSEVFNMVPYLATILALVIFSGKASGPKAAGEIYDAGKR